MLKLLQGNPAAALASFEGEDVNDYSRSVGRAMALHDLGRQAGSELALADQIKKRGDTHPREVATVYGWTGDASKACEWLEKAYPPDMTGFFREVFEPVWRNMHGEPCWTDMRERAGSSVDRLAALEYNVTLSSAVE